MASRCLYRPCWDTSRPSTRWSMRALASATSASRASTLTGHVFSYFLPLPTDQRVCPHAKLVTTTEMLPAPLGRPFRQDMFVHLYFLFSQISVSAQVLRLLLP